MARFDVYAIKGDIGFLLDCQTNFLSQIDTRVVVPLLPREAAPPIASVLNPIFMIGEDEVVMVTQSISAVRAGMLGKPISSLDAHRYVISNALDMLFTGY